MPNTVVLPKLGNTVESSILVTWLKQPGDTVATGEPLCVVETDKATMEVVSTAAGTLLQHLVKVGDDVPVLAPLAVIGEAHEQTLRVFGVSPRARALAQANGLDASQIAGSGPGGRIIERDVQAALTPTFSLWEREKARLTPVAKAMVEGGGYVAPERGSGPGGRVTKRDLRPTDVETRPSTGSGGASLQHDGVDKESELSERFDPYDVISLPNIRRVIAERMRASLQSTAQLTMHASADARALLGYRQRLKASDEALGLRGVTINDLVLFAVARTLPAFPQLNATFSDGELREYQSAHLGFAVDTPRGLLAPVIRKADRMTLRQLAHEASQLVKAGQDGKLAPDALNGGTFTVTNLGRFEIESFTPLLNAPQVAILGVGNINLKAVEQDGAIQHIPHIGLSLTIDHQIVDGAPGAKFLQALARNLAQFELLLAL